jgi:hypothetical protein
MNKTQNNTIYIKKSKLDQFYTSENISKLCYNQIIELYNLNTFDIFLEPSAGTGSFFNLFPESKRLGIDLEPQCSNIKQQDFFEFIPPKNKSIITIGNPPFGKNSSLAVKFFNTASEFSDVIAFIIPKTFRKTSLQNRLNLNFHLKLDNDLPKNSFILNDEPYDVPCCFQIWERQNNQRQIEKINLENDYFNFVKKKYADLAIRRVGGRTGKATKDINTSAEVSHYFLKLKDTISIDWLLEIINNIDFTNIINSTAGVKSLSKPEFVITLLNTLNI